MKRNKLGNKIFMVLLSCIFICSSILPSTTFGGQQASAASGPITLQYDFGTATSPVMSGYTGVHESELYTNELGYGLDQAVASRNRSGGDDMTNDFVLGLSYSFLVDLPNGDYDVTVYSGDLLAGTSTTKTTITLEGSTAGSISSKQAVNQATYRTTVQDGQLTVGITGTGVGGYLNGLIIQQIVPGPLKAPEGLVVHNITPTEVSLGWGSVTEAVYYNIYRTVLPSGTIQAIGQAAANSYVDSDVNEGSGYIYNVSAVNGKGEESVLSASVTVDKIPGVEVPAAPTGLSIVSVGVSSVQLSWNSVAGANRYTILRSDAADGTFHEIGQSEKTTFTDASADTSKRQYYGVKAANGQGESELSNKVESAVYTPPGTLPEGDVYSFDFGPGAVAEGYLKADAGVSYSSEVKYGFTDISKVTGVDRGTSDPLRSDFVVPKDATFNVDLPNGDYTVSLIAGDSAGDTEIGIKVESIQKVQQTSKTPGKYLEMSFDIALVDGQMNLVFSGTKPNINALVITKQPDRPANELPTVYIAGDSTVQTYDPYWIPQAGWGQMIPDFFSEEVTFKNHAIGGRSSKSFIVEGRLDEVLRKIQPGDYFLIQFGHNDATISVPDRYASPADYKVYLKTYVNGARQRGATPILVTPMGRRDYNAASEKFNVSFPEYVQAMKEVASELDVDLVDLSALSVAYYNSIGFAATRSVFLHLDAGIYGAFPNGSTDDTHFQEYGAIQMARLLAKGIGELNIPLSSFVQDIKQPETVPAKPEGLVAGSISNAGAVLKWNTVEGTDIYKIYRKLAAEAESAYTLAGTSTVPSLTLSGLVEGQSYSVRVTAVNGLGESEPSDEVKLTTKSAQYRYDFGPVGSPVAAGYTEVNVNVLYTPERGYGLTSSAGMIDRDRGNATDDLRRDFVIYFGGSYEFKVDLPNGYYSVKTYTGDWIGSAKTNVAIEGKDYGTVSSGKENIAEKLYNQIAVKDGQMNLVFSGTTAHLNGLEITPLLLAPTNLKLGSLDLNSEPITANLSWDSMEGALKYRIYRQATVANSAELLGETIEPFYADTTADIGMEYIYTVTSVDSTGLESVGSNALKVSMIDPSVAKAPVPSGLAVQSTNKNDVTFTWNEVPDARMFNIYRAKSADGEFILIGKSFEASYTDMTVLTTIPYYYKVASVNAGGISDLSATLETSAVTTLYRKMEALDRAPVAVKTDEGVYISWRMLGLDPETIGFNLYRGDKKLNDSLITQNTNYLDITGREDAKYRITSVINGVEKSASEPFSVWQKQYLSIPLQKPADDYTKDGQPYTYSAGDASVGDLDGDGVYEIIMLWSPSNSKDNSQAGYTGLVYMDAYKLDGTRLWRINLGPNIRAGAHYSPFLVYDLDSDGRADIMIKTADGTVDGQGKVIGNASADYRNSSGYVLLGNEYLTVFEGATGRALDTVDYDPPRGDVGAWGDTYGNRVDRFLAAVAYLDGEQPSVIFSRGYYTRTVLAAYNYREGKLEKVWRFDSNDEGYGDFVGQGNHNLSVGDVDGDGKDEITFGAMAIDDDGLPLYNTKLGHGDAIHFGDLDPTRPGLEVFDVHEHTDSKYGIEMRDAATGDILWGVFTGIDTGRGMSADIDPRYAGEEVWAATITNEEHIPVTGLYSAQGELITKKLPSSTNFGIWWDGDLLRELLDANRVDKWDYSNQTTVNLLTAVGASSNNGTKANPSLQADLFGDWREEVIWRATDSSELRIYTTTDMTDYRIRTLMHDPIYRLAVAWQNVGYNQPPHPGFFLSEGMEQPAAPKIQYVGSPGETEDTTPPTISGLPSAQMSETDVLKVQVVAEDPESGIRSLDITFDGKPVVYGDEIPLTELAGAHTFIATAINNAGLSTTEQVIVVVSGPQKATGVPGQWVLSNNNGQDTGLLDGDYQITMNMWWGNNGTVYKLYENGALIDTQTLRDDSPAAQTAVTNITGKENGTYTYTAELTNSFGTTVSAAHVVIVKDAAPAKPVLSNDNWDGDGEYKVTMNLWWGMNGKEYRLYENGILIDTKTLTAGTPNAQTASTSITNRSPGVYEYRAELLNDQGVSESAIMKVTVK